MSIQKREFLYSEDMTDACVFLMENRNFKDIIEQNNSTLNIQNLKLSYWFAFSKMDINSFEIIGKLK